MIEYEEFSLCNECNNRKWPGSEQFMKHELCESCYQRRLHYKKACKGLCCWKCYIDIDQEKDKYYIDEYPTIPIKEEPKICRECYIEIIFETISNQITNLKDVNLSENERKQDLLIAFNKWLNKDVI